MDMNQMMDSDVDSGIERDIDKEASASRQALVKQWAGKVTDAKGHFDKQFKKMRADMKFARGKQWEGNDNSGYTANLTLRHINQRVASIYAKNPTAVAQRKKRLDFVLWDGSVDSMKSAMMAVQQAAVQQMQPPPEAIMLLEDIERGKKMRAMYDKIGKTLEIVFKYSLDEPMPRFKAQAKQLIRRVVTTGVGFVKLGYQREMQQSPDVESTIKDHSSKIARIEMLANDAADGELTESMAEMEELKIGLKELQELPEIIVREGLVFDFPKSTQIIIDPACTQLQGFVGANWIAHEILMTTDEIKTIYQIDVGSNYTAYNDTGKKAKKDGNSKNCLVYEIYDLRQQTVYTVCEGYPDFLKQGAPDVQNENFHPFFVLTFNDVEDEENIYPPSDVELIRPMQLEHNRAREGVREHRISNRPAWVAAKGMLEGDDKTKLSNHAVNELLELNLERGTDIRTVLQQKPNNPIDPAVYDTGYLFEDIQRTLGSQEADFGGTSGATATESSIAENTRVSSVQSNIDELDDFLSNIARAAGQILLAEMSAETVKKIAGDGAVWPTLSAKEAAEEIYLEIKAGSSGRPNRALKLANLERIAPFVLQSPNLNPEWWLRKLLTDLDDDIDLDEAILAGMPSIIAQNANAQLSTGDASTDPNAQGAQGGNNAKQPQQTAGGAQAAFGNNN